MVRVKKVPRGQSTKSIALFVATLLSFVTAGRGNAEEPLEAQHFDLQPFDADRDRLVPLRIYRPSIHQSHPVILFSHGLGGSREGNAYLGEHWSQDGFVCVFLQHPGSDRNVWKSKPLRRRMAALKKAANSETLVDRLEDVRFVLNVLESWNRNQEHPLYGWLDLEHIGMSGHSFGAITTLGVAGRKFALRSTFEDDRIDAFLAMSPQAGTGVPPERAFGSLKSPILCMTGTEDGNPIDRDVEPESRRVVYDSMPKGDKYQLVLDGGHHFTFSEGGGRRASRRDPNHHPTIERISVAFWNAYLRGDQQAKKWLQSDQPRTACELKESDIWQWK